MISVNLEKQKAQQDFETIKTTLDQTRTNYNGLQKLFLRYAIIQSFLLLCNLILGAAFKLYLQYPFLPITISMITAIYMVFYYFKIYGQESTASNKFYLSCIGMWGIMVVAFPFIDFALRILTGFLITPDYLNQATLLSVQFSYLIEILLVCSCFIICAFLLNRKILIAAAVILLSAFLTVDLLCFATDTTQIDTNSFHLFYYACIILGYLFLSFLLRRRNSHGHQ